MSFIQPQVEPLPPGIDLTNKTAIVTGATSGIGLELSRQLLAHNLSTLILAVRNISKGEQVRKDLLGINPKAVVQVLKLDTEDYASVKAFAEAFRDAHGQLHLLMLNAGIADVTFGLASSGHERNLQVNYLSNVLLTLLLLPTLEHTAQLEGSHTRITWTGSRMHLKTSLASKVPLKKDEGIFEHFDSPGVIPPLTRYGDTKLLVLLFQHELAARYPPKVIMNHFCPGMVESSMTDLLPLYIRLPALLVKALRARSVDKAGWIGLHAALVLQIRFKTLRVTLFFYFNILSTSLRVKSPTMTANDTNQVNDVSGSASEPEGDHAIGEHLATIFSHEFEPVDTPVSIEDEPEVLCSYSWTSGDELAAYVPGKPPVADQFPIGVITVSREETFPILERNPNYPFEVVFKATQHLHSDVTFGKIDILTHSWTLRYLFKWLAGNGKRKLKLELALIKNTLIITDKERYQQNLGFKSSILQQISKRQLEDAITHGRVVKYDLGGLSCAVCCPIDMAYRKKDGNLGGTYRDHAAFLVAQDTKQMKTIDKFSKVAAMPNMLWFSRFSYVICRKSTYTGNDECRVQDIQPVHLAENFRKWETINQQNLRKLVRLLRGLRELTKTSQTKSCVAESCEEPHQDQIEVFAAAEHISPIPPLRESTLELLSS
ncbi:hypothetical protein F53441_12580 [Fusarium austroafricanum]|uniref:Uncharacterized protein n=1 Tax=Fusarium austroafricanum TaxID=2364996 RepID=A0A8H4NNI4_9HYPO|nr:hypothetical protein F53441_12580 [Fusarium austroafricanum]